MLTAARESTNPFDFALVCLLGLLGLRIFEAVGADIDDLGEEHGHRVLRVRGKGGKVVLVPLPPAVSRAVERAAGDRPDGPCCSTGRAPGWTGMPPPGDCASSRAPLASACRGCTPTCSGTRS
jgi:integrase